MCGRRPTSWPRSRAGRSWPRRRFHALTCPWPATGEGSTATHFLNLLRLRQSAGRAVGPSPRGGRARERRRVHYGERGRDFATAARTLAELGYWVDAFVMDAKYFVPQSRPRVFVVAVHDRLDTAVPFRQAEGGWIADGWTQVLERAHPAVRPANLVELMRSVQLPTGWAAFDLVRPPVRRREIGDLIDLDDDQDWWDAAAVAKHHDMMSDRHRPMIDDLIRTRADFVGTIFRRKRQGKTRAEVRFDGMAGCLRTPKGGKRQADRRVRAGGAPTDAVDVAARVRPTSGGGRFSARREHDSEPVRVR